MIERIVLLFMSNIMLQQESVFTSPKDSLSIGNRKGQRCGRHFTGVFVVLLAEKFKNVD